MGSFSSGIYVFPSAISCWDFSAGSSMPGFKDISFLTIKCMAWRTETMSRRITYLFIFVFVIGVTIIISPLGDTIRSLANLSFKGNELVSNCKRLSVGTVANPEAIARTLGTNQGPFEINMDNRFVALIRFSNQAEWSDHVGKDLNRDDILKRLSPLPSGI